MRTTHPSRRRFLAKSAAVAGLATSSSAFTLAEGTEAREAPPPEAPCSMVGGHVS